MSRILLMLVASASCAVLASCGDSAQVADGDQPRVSTPSVADREGRSTPPRTSAMQCPRSLDLLDAAAISRWASAPETVTHSVDEDSIVVSGFVPNPPQTGGRPQGAVFTLPVDVATCLQSKTARLQGKVAHQGSVNADTPRSGLAYSTNMIGNSGFLMFDPSDDETSFSFDYKIGTYAGDVTPDFVAIIPAAGEPGQSVRVTDLKLMIIQE